MDERFGRERIGRRYEDEERLAEERPGDYEGRRYRGEGYYGGYYQPSRSRGSYSRERRPDDRGFLDRAGDEVRSWFGDEEAERRRREDERDARQRGWRMPPGSRMGRTPDYPEYGDDLPWARQWGYVDRPYERGVMPEERPWRDEYGRGEPWRGGERSWPVSRYGPMGYGAQAPREDTSRARGPYTGRGPKGYQRSDERIREDICERLAEDGDLDAIEIEVRVVNREVTLQGSVGSRTDKRLAEDIIDSVSGVSEVHNQLRITQGAEPSQVDWRHRAA